MFLNDDILTGEYVGTFEYFRKTQNVTRGKAGDKKCRIVVKWHIYNKQNRHTCQEVCDECFAG